MRALAIFLIGVMVGFIAGILANEPEADMFAERFGR